VKKKRVANVESLAKVADMAVHRALEVARSARLAVNAQRASTQHQLDTQRRLRELSTDALRQTQPMKRKGVERGIKRFLG
jgi:hypothetical protein